MTDVYLSHNSLIGYELGLRIPFKGMESNVDFHTGACFLIRFTYRIVNLKLIHVKGCESYDDSQIQARIQSQFQYKDGNPVKISQRNIHIDAWESRVDSS